MTNPFVQHDGRIYLIENWREEMTGKERLTIRPLTKKEVAIWRKNYQEFRWDTYALIVRRPN